MDPAWNQQSPSPSSSPLNPGFIESGPSSSSSPSIGLPVIDNMEQTNIPFDDQFTLELSSRSASYGLGFIEQPCPDCYMSVPSSFMYNVPLIRSPVIIAEPHSISMDDLTLEQIKKSVQPIQPIQPIQPKQQLQQQSIQLNPVKMMKQTKPIDPRTYGPSKRLKMETNKTGNLIEKSVSMFDLKQNNPIELQQSTSTLSMKNVVDEQLSLSIVSKPVEKIDWEKELELIRNNRKYRIRKDKIEMNKPLHPEADIFGENEYSDDSYSDYDFDFY